MFGYDFGLTVGRSAETSGLETKENGPQSVLPLGGLLVVLPRDAATAYCREMDSLGGGSGAWIVGVVVDASGERTRGARIMPDARVIRVPKNDSPNQLW